MTRERKEYRCGTCGKQYTTDEYLALKRVPVDPNDPERYGNTAVCGCGHNFHKDQWRLRETVRLANGIEVDVSTVDLQMNHAHGDSEPDLWYETMLFAKEWDGKEVECNYQNRYESKKEAIADHERMMKALRDGKFTVSVTKVELEVDA